MKKICKACGDDRDTGDYSPHPKTRDKLQPICRPCNAARLRQSRRDNPERGRVYHADPAVRERTNAWARQYQKEHPDYARALGANRRAGHLGETGRIGEKDIKAIYAEQNGKCAYCGIDVGDDYHIDHKVALVRKGPNVRANVCIACSGCNFSKRTKTPEEFLSWRAALTASA